MTEDIIDNELSAAFGGRLENGLHRLVQRVYYEDTDFSGVVYHARYLQFLERGRTEFLRCLGVGQAKLREIDEEGLAFAVHHMDITFKWPARMDDIVEIRTTTRKTTGARMVLDQEIRANGVTLILATVTVVAVNAKGRARRLPDDLAATMARGAGLD
ncbi:tol-pal system-associated acyl-CoA thioesterase [Martelella alba]|uniref:Tol-pal system-associated acyl-CoA thioesterase n=1 Tax=Martelella alba TaxID=2590451 RepID=A0A506UFQ4_9HYPH|nr:tol-pal system-associated acyl-CoA thioesterase [Martelella alba]TPW31855.1 tol-pal system-associated acyl-CoA thioesterase [Martelella alba]